MQNIKDKYSKIKNSNIAKYEIQISCILSSFQLPKWRSPGEGWLENPSPTDCPGMRLEITPVLQIYLEIPTLFFFSRMKLLFKQLKVKFCKTTSVVLRCPWKTTNPSLLVLSHLSKDGGEKCHFIIRICFN